jgi:hypothetical protein
MEKLTPEELKRNLQMFTGTKAYHRTGFRTRSTDGVVYLAENAVLLPVVMRTTSDVGAKSGGGRPVGEGVERRAEV